jgi:CheY-like chemotaxis protein
VSARILVIEDNPTNLDLMTYVLRALGYEVSYEMDGVAGLEAAQAGAFDLVLADILMPNLDGFELARRFKADPKLAATPLVAVTALAMAGDREKILASGFDGYISKPIDPQMFAGQIEALLQRAPDGQSPHR